MIVITTSNKNRRKKKTNLFLKLLKFNIHANKIRVNPKIWMLDIFDIKTKFELSTVNQLFHTGRQISSGTTNNKIPATYSNGFILLISSPPS
jgi:hypothetical protein